MIWTVLCYGIMSIIVGRYSADPGGDENSVHVILEARGLHDL